MINPPRITPSPEIKRISLDNWLDGYNSQLEEGRITNAGLIRSLNAQLDQNGTATPRQSLIEFGVQPIGTPLGELYEFVKVTATGSENWMALMMVVGGTANVYVKKDYGNWQKCLGKDYDTTHAAHFFQADDKIGILNGKDTLSYINIKDFSITQFTALPDPTTAPTAAPASALTTGVPTSPNRYKYTYSNTGETIASAAVVVNTNLIRGGWTNPTTQYIDLTIPRIAGADRINIYWGEVVDSEFLIASIPNPASGTTVTWRDTGADQKDVTRPAPFGNNTAGIIGTRGTVINSQIFITGISQTSNDGRNESRYVYFGGTGNYMFDFSPFNGGGWVEVGAGTKEFPVRVLSFRNGRGESVITCICRGTNGTGKRFVLAPFNQTQGDTIISTFSVQEDNGQDGTDSPDGIISYRDSLWYPSRDGFKTTGTKAQLQNVLSTSDISQPISRDIRRLNTSTMDKVVGLATGGRLYWAVPNGQTYNNEIWTLDLQRKSAWMLPFDVRADWMTMYNDNNGQSHFLILQGNKILEFTEAFDTTDFDGGFNTNLASGLIKFSDDGMEWARVIDVTFVLLRPKGNIVVSVQGKTEETVPITLSSEPYGSSDASSVAGWGEAGWGMFGWGESEEVPTAFGRARETVTIEVDEDVNWIMWELNSVGAGVKYQLSDVIVRYVPIGVIEQ